METLTLENVKYEYRNKYQTVHALAGVSHVFERGNFYAVVGKSGSGKTTLLSMLAGLDNPTSGDVLIGEIAVRGIDRDKYRLRHISVIYQSLNLFPLLTAIENVMFPLEYKKTPKAEARRIAVEKLQSVGIDESMFRRLPSMLSGGEQQRVAIARALANKAEFILADEPTGNLDTENSANIVQLLKDLASKENICVIVVTHDPAVSDEADVVLRISDGVILQDEQDEQDDMPDLPEQPDHHGLPDALGLFDPSRPPDPSESPGLPARPQQEYNLDSVLDRLRYLADK